MIGGSIGVNRKDSLDDNERRASESTLEKSEVKEVKYDLMVAAWSKEKGMGNLEDKRREIVGRDSSRPSSVRVDHGYSILVVCLAGASATLTVKTDA